MLSFFTSFERFQDAFITGLRRSCHSRLELLEVTLTITSSRLKHLLPTRHRRLLNTLGHRDTDAERLSPSTQQLRRYYCSFITPASPLSDDNSRPLTPGEFLGLRRRFHNYRRCLQLFYFDISQFTSLGHMVASLTRRDTQLPRRAPRYLSLIY